MCLFFVPKPWHTFCRTFAPSATTPVETRQRHQYSLPKTMIPVCLRKIYTGNLVFLHCFASNNLCKKLKLINKYIYNVGSHQPKKAPNSTETKTRDEKPQRSGFENDFRSHWKRVISRLHVAPTFQPSASSEVKAKSLPQTETWQPWWRREIAMAQKNSKSAKKSDSYTWCQNPGHLELIHQPGRSEFRDNPAPLKSSRVGSFWGRYNLPGRMSGIQAAGAAQAAKPPEMSYW